MQLHRSSRVHQLSPLSAVLLLLSLVFRQVPPQPAASRPRDPNGEALLYSTSLLELLRIARLVWVLSQLSSSA